MFQQYVSLKIFCAIHKFHSHRLNCRGGWLINRFGRLQIDNSFAKFKKGDENIIVVGGQAISRVFSF